MQFSLNFCLAFVLSSLWEKTAMYISQRILESSFSVHTWLNNLWHSTALEIIGFIDQQGGGVKESNLSFFPGN